MAHTESVPYSTEREPLTCGVGGCGKEWSACAAAWQPALQGLPLFWGRSEVGTRRDLRASG
eukprot:scaffold54651_cov40-Tisochrysis_lutea.AAC.2